MKMTKEQVAELLLRMNEDCSNLEYLDKGEWKPTLKNYIGHILQNIISGYTYRIKDNAVKEVTPALRGKWVKNKQYGYEVPIEYLRYNDHIIGVDGILYDVKQFNEQWQLVED